MEMYFIFGYFKNTFGSRDLEKLKIFHSRGTEGSANAWLLYNVLFLKSDLQENGWDICDFMLEQMHLSLCAPVTLLPSVCPYGRMFTNSCIGSIKQRKQNVTIL